MTKRSGLVLGAMMAAGCAGGALAETVTVDLEAVTAPVTSAASDTYTYQSWREDACAACAVNEDAVPIFTLDPALMRRIGYRWHDKDRLGVAFNAGPVRYGLWGDVREVNTVATSESGLVPTLSTVGASSSSGMQMAPGNTPGNTLTATGPFMATNLNSRPRSLSPGTSPAPVNRPLSNTRFTMADSGSNGGSDVAYTEYIAGFFVAAPF